MNIGTSYICCVRLYTKILYLYTETQRDDLYQKKEEIYIYMFDAILISLPSLTDINTLCIMVDGERCSVFRVDHWLQRLAGRLCLVA